MNKNILKIVKFLAIIGIWIGLFALAGLMEELVLIVIMFAMLMIMVFVIGALAITLLNLQEK